VNFRIVVCERHGKGNTGTLMASGVLAGHIAIRDLLKGQQLPTRLSSRLHFRGVLSINDCEEPELLSGTILQLEFWDPWTVQSGISPLS
jgi:hypothetical protein